MTVTVSRFIEPAITIRVVSVSAGNARTNKSTRTNVHT